MTLTFNRLTFQLSKSEEKLGNLSDIALSTLFSNPFGPFWIIFLSKLTLDLIDDIEPLQMDICMRISRFKS